jgi:hypothetical protein
MIEKLTNYQASMIITDAQLRIARAMKEQSELEPQVKEYYDAYATLKDKLDSTKKKIDEDNLLLKMASEQLNHIKTGKDFRVVRAESHLEMKDREKRKLNAEERRPQIKWTQFAIDTLTVAGQMLTIDQLWDIALEKLNIPEKGRSKIKWGCVNNCWMKTNKLFSYKEKIGLDDWKDNPGKYYRSIAV